MSQTSIVFLIDLVDRGSELAKLLSRSGLSVRQLGTKELETVLADVTPHAIVAPHTSAEAVAEVVRQLPWSRELTFFATAPESAGPHVKGALPREVTAVVRDDIDPGILSLRIKAATQRMPSQRAHGQTLVGVVNPLNAPPTSGPSASSSPLASSASESSTPAAFPGGSWPASPMGSDTSGSEVPPPVAPAHPSVPPQPSISQPPGAPVAQGLSPSVPPTPSQPAPPASIAPPIAAPIEPFAPAPSVQPPAEFKDAAQKRNDPLALHAMASTPPSQSVTSLQPAQPVVPEPARPEPVETPKNQLGVPRIVAGVAAVGLLVAGAAFAFSSGDDASDAPPSATASAEPAAVAPTPTPTTPAPTTPPAPPEPAPEKEAPAAQHSPSAHELYRVKSVETIDDCDKVLEKSPEDYDKEANWKGAQAWKTARRHLLHGKNDLAFRYMCESAMIDPAGPATGGLVNYFLRNRAIEQAKAWAERGVAAAPSSRSAKESLGDALSQLGKVDEARALWLETAKLSASDRERIEAVARNWVKAAKKAQKGGDWALAERMLRRAAAFDDTLPEVALEMGITLQKNDQTELAKNWAKKAVELDPQSESAQELLASFD